MLPNSIIKMMRDIERMTEGPMVALSRAFEERQRILNGPASEIARSIQEANRIRTENENSLLGVLERIPVMPQGIPELLEHAGGAFRHSEIQNVLSIYKGYIEQTESFFQNIQPQFMGSSLAACKAIQDANRIIALCQTLENQYANAGGDEWDFDENKTEGFTSLAHALEDFVSSSISFLSKADQQLYATIINLLKKCNTKFPLLSCILVFCMCSSAKKIIETSASSYFVKSQPSFQSKITNINISIIREERREAEQKFGISIRSIAITTTNVKAFRSPKKHAAQVVVLERGHIVYRLEKVGRWVLVEFKVDGGTVMRGYVRSKYLKEI